MFAKTAAISLLAMLATTSNLTAQGGIWGAGAKTCGEFAALYQTSPEVWESTFFSWAQGWLSADNMYCEIGQDIASFDPKTKKTDPDNRCPTLVTPTFGAAEQMAFVRKFCADNPLRQYGEAVGALLDQIRVRQGLPTIMDSVRKKYQEMQRQLPAR